MRTFRAGPMLAGALGLAVLTGCEVTNPGPLGDDALAASEEAQQGLINGSERRMAEFVTNASYTMALLGKEIFPGGQTGSSGHDPVIQGGHIPPGTAGSGNGSGAYWNDGQQARFIAETAIVRFTEAGASDEMLYQAHLWAGFAYRSLGEWWCNAVVGGTNPDVDTAPGQLEEGTDTYFQRAVDNFTAALGFAADDDERFAALAGRAAANVWLENWAAAATDAAEVPDDFVFYLTLDGQEQAYYNEVFWANAYTPYGSYSIDYTWFKGYYEATGDPRVPVFEDPEIDYAVGSLDRFGQVPWSNQAKYTDRGDDHKLTSGWEMRLVEAEAILAQGGDPADALALINEVHTRNISDLDGVTPLAAVTGTTSAEVYTALKRERAVELWLEGRRAPDLRRWGNGADDPAAGTPPPVDWTTLSGLFADHPRSYCFDIPDGERDSNPNVPPATGS